MDMNFDTHYEAIEALESEFPNLSKTNYEITSKRTRTYNCFAYAMGEDDIWWSPLPGDEYYWPEKAPREENKEAFVLAFQTRGFQVCSDGEFEAGFLKIAIYAKANGCPTHAAKQSNSGIWTSKLGIHEDIEHELNGISGDEYGEVSFFMKKTIN